MADVNGDGKIDAIVPNSTSSVSVLLNTTPLGIVACLIWSSASIFDRHVSIFRYHHRYQRGWQA